MEATSIQTLQSSEHENDTKNNSPPTEVTHPSHEPQASPPTHPAHPSPRHSLRSNSSGAAGETLTNFQKYGSIRPPISVLQDEFLVRYQQWKEHADAIKGLEGIRAKEYDEEAWKGCMDIIQLLYNRHHKEDAMLVGALDSKRLNSEIRDVFQESEEMLIGEDVIDHSVEEILDEEYQQMKHLADVLFGPGSKFIGAIQLPAPSSSASQSLINRDLKSYELVVMESDGVDEIGNQKGILCRHKIRGDEQCVFMKMGVVPLKKFCVDDVNLDEKEYADTSSENADKDNNSEDQKGADEISCQDRGASNQPASDVSDAPSAPKYTIQIEYSDGETHCHGYWDHKASRFNGTVQVVSAGRNESNPMGGTIISGLIGGRSSGSIAETEEEHTTGRRRSSIKHTSQLHSFLLSPCTHNHPRGINPVPLHSLAEFLEMEDVTHTNVKPISPALLVEEVLSPDNLKIISHRARSAALRKEVLIKLVELGGYMDFSELARKRNVSQRREKWRNAIGRFKPKFPKSWRRRLSTSSHKDEPKVEKKKVQFYDHLAAISWTDLLEESGIQSEKVCATFRRRVSLLNSLSFPTDEYKIQAMGNLRANGLSLMNSHAEWDQCIQMGRTIALGWSWFERGSWGCFERSAVVGRRCVHILFQMHSRQVIIVIFNCIYLSRVISL